MLLLHGVPDAVRGATKKAGFDPDAVTFSVRGDLDLAGDHAEVWTIASAAQIASFVVTGPRAGSVVGPVAFAQVDKIRTRQRVGSSFLALRIDGLYVEVARYSNTHRERFGRVATYLERRREGKTLPDTYLTKPSEQLCPKCGLPLPGRGAGCPRCLGGRGIFGRTLGLMRPYLLSILALLATMLLGVSLDLIPPLLTRTLVDRVIQPPHEHVEWLIWILLGLVGASASRGLLNIFIGRTTSIIGTRITRDLRERLQRKLLSLAVDYYNRHSVGSLMSRVLYDVDYFQSFVQQVAQGFLLNVMLVFGIGAMLFYMNWQLALLVLLPTPFVIVGTTFFWRIIYPRHFRVWDSQSKTAQLLSGLLSGIRLVKSFGQEAREEQRFGRAASYLQQSRRNLETSVATFSPIMGFVFGLGGLIIWWAGGRRVMAPHGITLGTLMAFFGYVGMFYGPISALSMFSNWVSGFLAAGQRVFEVLDAQVAVKDAAAPVRLPKVEGRIEFRNVTFGYDPYSPVLNSVSMTIEPGQFIGIVGKSGSGKTTLVNLLCRFYDVQEGQVLLDGVDVRELAQEDVHRHVALVLQEPFLFRATIAENIAYGRPDAPPEAIIHAARAANAHEFISRRPAGYDTRLGEHGAGLSGGERQRISIARALLCDPRILILDEATSSVDTESEQEIQKALTVVCKGRTTIAIAHRLSTLKNSDRIFVVDDGRITESGSHEELMALQGTYCKLVRIQTELTRLDV